MPTPLQNTKKTGRSVDRYKKGVNTGVFASKYNFGINNLRCETAPIRIDTSSKRKALNTSDFFGFRFFGFHFEYDLITFEANNNIRQISRQQEQSLKFHIS